MRFGLFRNNQQVESLKYRIEQLNTPLACDDGKFINLDQVVEFSSQVRRNKQHSLRSYLLDMVTSNKTKAEDILTLLEQNPVKQEGLVSALNKNRKARKKEQTVGGQILSQILSARSESKSDKGVAEDPLAHSESKQVGRNDSQVEGAEEYKSEFTDRLQTLLTEVQSLASDIKPYDGPDLVQMGDGLVQSLCQSQLAGDSNALGGLTESKGEDHDPGQFHLDGDTRAKDRPKVAEVIAGVSPRDYRIEIYDKFHQDPNIHLSASYEVNEAKEAKLKDGQCSKPIQHYKLGAPIVDGWRPLTTLLTGDGVANIQADFDYQLGYSPQAKQWFIKPDKDDHRDEYYVDYHLLTSYGLKEKPTLKMPDNIEAYKTLLKNFELGNPKKKEQLENAFQQLTVPERFAVLQAFFDVTHKPGPVYEKNAELFNCLLKNHEALVCRHRSVLMMGLVDSLGISEGVVMNSNGLHAAIEYHDPVSGIDCYIDLGGGGEAMPVYNFAMTDLLTKKLDVVGFWKSLSTSVFDREDFVQIDVVRGFDACLMTQCAFNPVGDCVYFKLSNPANMTNGEFAVSVKMLERHQQYVQIVRRLGGQVEPPETKGGGQAMIFSLNRDKALIALNLMHKVECKYAESFQSCCVKYDNVLLSAKEELESAVPQLDLGLRY